MRSGCIVGKSRRELFVMPKVDCFMVEGGAFHVYLSAGIIQNIGETAVALSNLVNFILILELD